VRGSGGGYCPAAFQPTEIMLAHCGAEGGRRRAAARFRGLARDSSTPSEDAATVERFLVLSSTCRPRFPFPGAPPLTGPSCPPCFPNVHGQGGEQGPSMRGDGHVGARTARPSIDIWESCAVASQNVGATGGGWMFAHMPSAHDHTAVAAGPTPSTGGGRLGMARGGAASTTTSEIPGTPASGPVAGSRFPAETAAGGPRGQFLGPGGLGSAASCRSGYVARERTRATAGSAAPAARPKLTEELV